MKRAARRALRRGAPAPLPAPSKRRREADDIFRQALGYARASDLLIGGQNEQRLIPAYHALQVEHLPVGVRVPIRGKMSYNKLLTMRTLEGGAGPMPPMKTILNACAYKRVRPDLAWVGRYTNADEIKLTYLSCLHGWVVVGEEMILNEWIDVQDIQDFAIFPVLPLAEDKVYGGLWKSIAKRFEKVCYWSSLESGHAEEAMNTYLELKGKELPEKEIERKLEDQGYTIEDAIESTYTNDLLQSIRSHDKSIEEEAAPFGDRVQQLVRAFVQAIDAYEQAEEDLQSIRQNDYANETMFGSLCIMVLWDKNDSITSSLDNNLFDIIQEHHGNYGWVMGYQSVVANVHGFTSMEQIDISPHARHLHRTINTLAECLKNKVSTLSPP